MKKRRLLENRNGEGWKEFFRYLGKGFVIGSTMTVPGVSGGTMAILVGCYDEILESVSHFFACPGKMAGRLLPVGIGGIGGIYLLSGIIGDYLLVCYPLQTRCFFLGVVAGSIPMLFAKTGIHGFRLKGENGRRIGWVLAGLLLVELLALLPEGLFIGTTGGVSGILLLGLAGVLIAAALVLPGISTSQMLLMLGLYEPVLQGIRRLELYWLWPLFAGLAAGTFAIARGLEMLVEKREDETWCVIAGFVLGSLPELFPDPGGGNGIFLGVVCAAAGFLPLFLIGRSGEQRI